MKWATDTFLPYLIFHYNFLQKSGNITEDLQVFHYHIAANVSNKKKCLKHMQSKCILQSRTQANA